MFNDYISVKGDVHITVWDENGTVKNEYDYTNLVVATGKTFIANKIAAPTQLVSGTTVTTADQYFYNGYLYSVIVGGIVPSSIPTLTTVIGGQTQMNGILCPTSTYVSVGQQFYYGAYIYTVTTAGTTGVANTVLLGVVSTTYTHGTAQLQCVGSIVTLQCDVDLTTDGLSIRYMGLGTGTSTPISTNTALDSQLSTRQKVSIAHTSGSSNLIISATFPGSAVSPSPWASSAITEAGMFTASTAGILVCRTTFGAFSILTTDTVGISWTLSIL